MNVNFFWPCQQPLSEKGEGTHGRDILLWIGTDSGAENNALLENKQQTHRSKNYFILWTTYPRYSPFDFKNLKRVNLSPIFFPGKIFTQNKYRRILVLRTPPPLATDRKKALKSGPGGEFRPLTTRTTSAIWSQPTARHSDGWMKHICLMAAVMKPEWLQF